MPDLVIYGFTFVALLLIYPVFLFFKSQGTKVLSRREAVWLIILSVITLTAIAVTFILDYPRY
jgi:hypothetical protein